MSERERWVIYPLLFLALGVALRDKMLHPIQEEVLCQRLVVMDPQRGRLAYLGPDAIELPNGTEQTAGGLVLYNEYNQRIALLDNQGLSVRGDVEVLAANGNPLVRVGTGKQGGTVEVSRQTGLWELALGTGNEFGGFLQPDLDRGWLDWFSTEDIDEVEPVDIDELFPPLPDEGAPPEPE